MERYEGLKIDLKSVVAAMKTQFDGMREAPKIEWSVRCEAPVLEWAGW